MLYGSWNRCSSSPWCCRVTRQRSGRGVGRLMSCSGTAVPDVRPSPSVFGRRRRSWGEGSRRKCTLVPHHSSPWPTNIGKNEDQLKDHMVRTSHGHKLELTNSWQLAFACRTKLCHQGNVKRRFWILPPVHCAFRWRWNPFSGLRRPVWSWRRFGAGRWRLIEPHVCLR